MVANPEDRFSCDEAHITAKRLRGKRVGSFAGHIPVCSHSSYGFTFFSGLRGDFFTVFFLCSFC